MHILAALAVILVALIAQSYAVVVTVGSVSCGNLTLNFNATLAEILSLPPYLRATIQGQSQIASLPNATERPKYGSDVSYDVTAPFDQPFVLTDGQYDVVLDLITSRSTNNSVASITLSKVHVIGCYATSSTSSGQTSSAGAVATATLNNNVPYYSPIGLPGHGIIENPGESEGGSGLGLGAKIGIAVGILGAALLAVLAGMAYLYRRRRQGQGESMASNKARRYANGRWINDEDRNSAELKEVSQVQV